MTTVFISPFLPASGRQSRPSRLLSPLSPPHLSPIRPLRTRLPPRSSLPLCISLPPPLIPAVSASTPIFLVFLLISSATFGILSQSTSWGKALSAPVVTTLLTLILSNILPLPSVHPVFSLVNTYLVPLAVPLLLFGADLRRVFRDTTRLVFVFILGSVSTVLGTLVAYKVIPLTNVLSRPDAWKVAAALCARHIGGAVNFVAVADALVISSDAVAAALAADNVVVALYFVLLLFLARGVSQPASVGKLDNVEVIGEDVSPLSADVGVPDVAMALSISSGMCVIAYFINALLPFRLGPIPVVTAIALVGATGFPKFFEKYRPAAAAVGVFFMQIFFAACGIAGSLTSVAKKAPMLLLFSVLQLTVHLISFLAVGGVLRFKKAEMLIASNANVGGPTTAAGMAAAKDWDRLLIPALLIGVFGYSIATFVSLALGHLVLKPM